LACFNRREKTKHCLRALLGQELPEFTDLQVFLCDDNSTDGTSEMLERLFPQIKVVKGDGSLFWGGGMRKAWAFAKESDDFDAYLWLNDDTFILPRGLNYFLEEYESIGSPAILSAACKIPDTEEFSYGGHYENMKPLPPNGVVQKVTYINGNLVLIPKEIEEKIGIISPIYIHYLGDFDYGLRAEAAGFSCNTTSRYLAECEANPPTGDWVDPKIPLSKRWKIAHDVKGIAISDFIYFKTHHHGRFMGFKFFVDSYLKLFFTDRYVEFRNLILKKLNK
jgi:GT2 family glycosyltransferase